MLNIPPLTLPSDQQTLAAFFVKRTPTASQPEHTSTETPQSDRDVRLSSCVCSVMMMMIPIRILQLTAPSHASRALFGEGPASEAHVLSEPASQSPELLAVVEPVVNTANNTSDLADEPLPQEEELPAKSDDAPVLTSAMYTAVEEQHQEAHAAMDTTAEDAAHVQDQHDDADEESDDCDGDESAYIKPHVNVFEVVVVEGKRQRKAVDRSLPEITEPAKKKRTGAHKGPKAGLLVCLPASCIPNQLSPEAASLGEVCRPGRTRHVSQHKDKRTMH